MKLIAQLPHSWKNETHIDVKKSSVDGSIILQQADSEDEITLTSKQVQDLRMILNIEFGGV